jgi:hypothetical protein
MSWYPWSWNHHAILDRLSPGCTTYTIVGGDVGAAASTLAPPGTEDGVGAGTTGVEGTVVLVTVGATVVSVTSTVSVISTTVGTVEGAAMVVCGGPVDDDVTGDIDCTDDAGCTDEEVVVGSAGETELVDDVTSSVTDADVADVGQVSTANGRLMAAAPNSATVAARARRVGRIMTRRVHTR